MQLVVCGHFDSDYGVTSGYAAQVFAELNEVTEIPSFGKGWYEVGDTFENYFESQHPSVEGWHFINGGTYEKLAGLDFTKYSTIIWFADIPNDLPKIVDKIKKKNPKCVLVTSKSNMDDEYKPLDIIERALRTKSNLLVEFSRDENKNVVATVWDALGNIYLEKSSSPGALHAVLKRQCQLLSKSRRVASKRVGKAEAIPNEEDFFALARGYAETFHKLIHAVNTERFVGNLSFRCENGFPTFRKENRIYVSRRNIDKRDINAEGFVAVAADELDPVHFFGDHKPSVDTPIQVQLYQMFPNINYMLHSHAYVQGAPRTDMVLACGNANEAIEVARAAKYMPVKKVGPGLFVVEAGQALYRPSVRSHFDQQPEVDFFAVNLLGHGSIVGAREVDQLKDIPYVARQIPERQFERTVQEVHTG